MKMPCGRSFFCGNFHCRHAATCSAKTAAEQAAASTGRTGTSGASPRENGTSHHTAQKASPSPKPATQPGPLARPADIVYLYDGSRPGFFSCVHESVYARELPAAIFPESEAQPSLFQQKLIPTDTQKAARVEASISKKIGPRATELLDNIFFSCLPEKEIAMLRFLLLGYRAGPRTPYMLGHTDVAPLLAAEKHLMGEVHLLHGFIRFSDYDGALAATITPKNFVLPFLAHHFATRFSGEDFLIFDKTHKAALIYQNKKRSIVPLEHIAFPDASEEEEAYRGLWKQFYKTIAIEARENPRCRMTHMPKRYWENMTEMQDLL